MITGDEDNDMARDFGFDIAMPDGNVGLPSAAHKLYMEQCKIIYREFVANMAVHMKTEKELKQALRTMHEEKIRNLRYSLYRSESTDPFAKRPETGTSTPAFLDSRVNTPWGLDIIPDNEEGSGNMRPQTAPAGGNGSRKVVSRTEQRPQTAVVGASLHEEDDGESSDSGLSEMSACTKSTVVGVIDKKSELSSGRKITVGSQSFTKITHGNVRAKFKHKDGKFIVKPVKVNFDSEAINSDTLAYDPTSAKQKFDPASERLALVRKITSFSTPTISSDMKINNRVPIQKRLKGQDAKRTTISEIYQDARDRRARHFRIVTHKPHAHLTDNPLSDVSGRQTRASNRWATAIRQSISAVSDKKTSNGRLFKRRVDETDENGDGFHSRPRSILLYSGTTATGGSRSLGESFNAKEMADNAFINVYNDISRRSNSRVAFARADSQMSHDSVFWHDENMDPNASFNCSRNLNSSNFPNPAFMANGGTPGQHGHGNKMFLAPPPGPAGGRTRTESFNSNEAEIRSRSNTFNHSERPSHSTADVKAACSPSKTSSAADGGGRDLTPAADKHGTVVTNANEKGANGKNKKNIRGKQETDTGTSGTSPEKKMSVTKVGSRRDTVTIVKQQMRMDKALDERMAVWRRRMAVKSSSMSVKIRPSGRKGKLI